MCVEFLCRKCGALCKTFNRCAAALDEHERYGRATCALFGVKCGRGDMQQPEIVSGVGASPARRSLRRSRSAGSLREVTKRKEATGIEVEAQEAGSFAWESSRTPRHKPPEFHTPPLPPTYVASRMSHTSHPTPQQARVTAEPLTGDPQPTEVQGIMKALDALSQRMDLLALRQEQAKPTTTPQPPL